MKLSIIIPVYNEEATIEEIIHRVKKVNLEKEIIIVDDGSTDGTREILHKLSHQDIKIIRHHCNEGKGAAIRTALNYASGDIVIIQDADLETDPQDYYKLIQPIVEGKTEVVYGSRFLNGNRNGSLLRFMANKVLTLFVNILYHTRITDEGTAYKVFNKDLINSLNLECKGFEFCPEVTAKILKKGYKIYEVPITYTPRLSRNSKIAWKDGLICLFTLVKCKFSE